MFLGEHLILNIWYIYCLFSILSIKTPGYIERGESGISQIYWWLLFWLSLYRWLLSNKVMSMSNPEVHVERLKEYRPEDAAGIGRLMPFLSERLSDEPMEEDLLRAIISSPHHEQLVARLEGLIVGAATMNLLMGPGAEREGYLEDFVTDAEVRGQGIGDKIWQEMVRWCSEQGVDFSFTSHPSRKAAHRFYLAHGAEVRETAVFHVPIDPS